MLQNQLISYIRTGVPLGVGLALTWVAEHFGLVINDDTKVSLAALAVTVITGLYYALVRALEAKWPQLGVLLGVPARPTYPVVGKPKGERPLDFTMKTGERGSTDVGTLLLVAIFVVVLILLFHGRIT